MTEHGATVRRPPPRTRRIVQVALSLVLALALLTLQGGATGGRVVVAVLGIAGLVAAVLVYRVLTRLLPVPVGVGTYLWWRRQALVAPGKEAPTPVGVEAT